MLAGNSWLRLGRGACWTSRLFWAGYGDAMMSGVGEHNIRTRSTSLWELTRYNPRLCTGVTVRRIFQVCIRPLLVLPSSYGMFYQVSSFLRAFAFVQTRKVSERVEGRVRTTGHGSHPACRPKCRLQGTRNGATSPPSGMPRGDAYTDVNASTISPVWVSDT